MALLAYLIAVPRAAEPSVLPLPSVDRSLQAREERSARERAVSARKTPLPFEVRAVGETFRRYGRAEAGGDETDAKSQLALLERTLAATRQLHLHEALLSLRAVQGELFVAALEAWESGADSAELAELGGSFITNAERFGWLDGPRHVALTRAERAILFKVRWTEVLGLRDVPPFTLSLNEWRSYYRCLLEHPQAPSGDVAARSRASLSYVAALAKRDSDFPVTLASGILRYRLGDIPGASRDFAEHLSLRPTGPWTLRARNHLVFTANLASSPALE